MSDLPQTWSRTLTVLKAMMLGHVVELDGYRVTARETTSGDPKLVVLATREPGGEDVPLGLDWAVEHLAAAVGRMSEEDYVGVVAWLGLRSPR